MGNGRNHLLHKRGYQTGEEKETTDEKWKHQRPISATNGGNRFHVRKKCCYREINYFFISGSKTHAVLEAVVTRKQLLKDVAMISPAEQTSPLEAFHRLILYFAPKNTHYFFPVMNAR